MSKFQVGDYVKCLKKFCRDDGPEVGKVYEVLSKNCDIIGVHCPDYKYSNDAGYMLGTRPNYNESFFELASKAEDIPKMLEKNEGWGFE